MKDYNKQIMEYLKSLLEVAIDKCPKDADRSVWLNGLTLDDIKTTYEDFTNYILAKEYLDNKYKANNKEN